MSKARSHESAAGHVSGSAVYTDDQRRPTGMLSAHPVLSPHARARITKLDVSGASKVPGVVTGIDLSGCTRKERLERPQGR